MKREMFDGDDDDDIRGQKRAEREKRKDTKQSISSYHKKNITTTTTKHTHTNIQTHLNDKSIRKRRILTKVQELDPRSCDFL